MKNNTYCREEIKFIVNKDLILGSSIWALVLLIVWGLISFITVWFMLNVIVPSYNKKNLENKDSHVVSYYEQYSKR